ncbi:ABC transporter permease [Vallitalea maricola]|uniref:ABC transporter permease n=1 Tax=Vallitalea maricola TaxID=3074433 RepID=A0ACB5UD28_9FIRM|nr:ABC transporter permease [Vallitalea sp. AN17-2]
MANLIKVEFKKLKGSNILWICLAGCFILPIISLMVGSNISVQSNWIDYCTQSMWMSILLLWPCIFGLMGTYIFTRERIENTYKNLFTIPVGRVSLVLSKLFVLLITIVCITFISYMLNLVGLFIGVKLTLNDFFQGLATYLMSGLLMFCAMLPVMFIALMSKKGFLVSICVTIVYALISFIGIWAPLLSSILPIISIMRICNITALSIEYSYPMIITYVSLFGITAVSLFGIIFAAKKQEA